MRALVLSVLAGLLLGCMSPTRTRELHCLGTLMVDVSESKQEMELIEKDWRARRQAEADQLSRSWYPLSESTSVPTDSPIPVSVPLVPGDIGSLSPAKNFGQTDALYRQLIQARARHHDIQAWYTRVARRVQTRFEEDDMLYSVLGMFVSAPASLLFYPIVRWNVRSVLWDGADPDADDDPIQQFCLTRID
jgi:hypothetical protein